MKISCKMLLSGIALAGRLMAALPPLAGDGVTDDTAAIQAGLDYLAARGGGKLYFPFTTNGYLVAAPAKLVEALRAQLAVQAQGGVKVVADEMTGAGFTVKLDGGRVEYDFTAATIAAELSKRLRPDLAKLMAEV